MNFWSLAGVVFILDRLTKMLVLKFIPFNSSVKLTSFFSLSHVLNTGTAFGLFRNAQWFFAFFALAVAVYIIAKYPSFAPVTQLLAALILAGALGNLVDRVLYGAVIDFIDFSFWPAFNIADSAISLAIIGLVVQEVRQEKQKI